MTGIDFRYLGEPGHIVSGKVRTTGSRGPRSVFLSLVAAPNETQTPNSPASYASAEESFAFYGIADGDYLLVAQERGSAEGEPSFVSSPIRVSVKGEDVAGLDITLAPLGALTGSIVFTGSGAGPCSRNKKRSLGEVVLTARKQANGSRPAPDWPLPFESETSAPDAGGNFAFPLLAAARYRLQAELPSDAWYLSSIAGPVVHPSRAIPGGEPASGPDLSQGGVPVRRGARTEGITIGIGADGATFRGTVLAGAPEIHVPELRIDLVPAESENVSKTLRYFETRTYKDNTFSIRHVAPGRYYVLARPLPAQGSPGDSELPEAFDPKLRANLRQMAEKQNVFVDLKPCQSSSGFTLRYGPPSK